MGRKIITYWKTDGERLAFYNILAVIKGLGCKPVTSIPLEEWIPNDDKSNQAEYKAFKKVCRLLDEQLNIQDGHYFTCRDNGKDSDDLEYTYVTVDDRTLHNVYGKNNSVPKFKLKKSNLWCIKCTMIPETVIEDDDNDDDWEDNWK